MSEGTPILTVQALNRLSYYQNYLQKRKNEGVELMTATMVAEDLGINEVVVRKDISAVRSIWNLPIWNTVRLTQECRMQTAPIVLPGISTTA